MRAMVNVLLFVLLTVVVVSIWFLRRDYTKRNQEFLAGMVVSIPYDAQAENGNFSDGKTLQAPVNGSEAQNYFPFHYKATAEDAKRAGEELFNPIADSLEKEVERGATVFGNICSPCHGAGGLGDGNIIKKGFPPPPSLFAEKAMNMKDGQMFHILTYGQNNMPSLAGQVQRMDRWRVITYVRSLQKKALQQMTTASSSLTGLGEGGKGESVNQGIGETGKK
ncbi:MAG: cytochrome c [Ignavibacteriae bacterium]|nr:cytochrome c [Ignavibacteriota bacterium]